MWNIKQVCFNLGLSKPTIYRLIKAGKFHAPLRISAKRSGWRPEWCADYLSALEAAQSTK